MRKVTILGSWQDDLEKNKQLGRLAAAHVSLAILCGSGADAVQCGMIEAGFSRENICEAQSAAHMRRLIHHLTQSGDVILQVLTEFNYMEDM